MSVLEKVAVILVPLSVLDLLRTAPHEETQNELPDQIWAKCCGLTAHSKLKLVGISGFHRRKHQQLRTNPRAHVLIPIARCTRAAMAHPRQASTAVSGALRGAILPLGLLDCAKRATANSKPSPRPR